MKNSRRAGEQLPIVGIGASAGGLAAFEAFFTAMPVDAATGMAFILVQHLAPDHESMLSELIERYTHMKVLDVHDGMKVEGDCIYIIPPNQDMALSNGTLRLLEPAAPRGRRLPIDFFFRSLADAQREHAICIVLSGTGSDGTLGVRAVKAEGGMVMAQTPESATYDGMPRSAIATGLVDYVLPPGEMPARLIAYSAHAFRRRLRALPAPALASEDAIKRIFRALQTQIGHDFSNYKQTTIRRRVERRMAVHQIERLDQYAHYLEEAPTETEALFADLLIGVTSFFRDPEAFASLEEHVIPQLFADKSQGSAVRVWVPGCSTGEEAYSIALLLCEQMERLKTSFSVQVFATDIDRRAIDVARAGSYPASIAADVSPERLVRFFSQAEDGNSYRINKRIRDILLFAEQDVIKDPPFSRLDLISCRNVLIYMDGALQRRLIPLFHYALNPRGWLFLGTSESVGDLSNLFTTGDRKAKLYQRKEALDGAQHPLLGRVPPALIQRGPALEPFKKAPADVKLPLRELTERALLQHFATTVAALVDEHGDVLYLHGRAGRYLEPVPGEASMNIVKMAREGLRRDLRMALSLSEERKEPVRRPGLRVTTNGDFATVDLTVRCVSNLPAGIKSKHFIVVFEESAFPGSGPSDKIVASAGSHESNEAPNNSDARVVALEQELLARDECLRTLQEEMQTSSEELKSSNEELQSMNEELQSTNEELETSKEELQSLNEELATVNAELQVKVTDLSRANNDMNNLLAGTDIGTIFVDHQLRIQRFTPAATQLINLIQSDIGRPVGHLVSNLVGYDQLVTDVKSVLDTLVPKEVEVQSQAGAWYLLRIRPYRTLENVIEGAVITFTEITDTRNARATLRQSEALRRLAVVVRDARDAITVQDFSGRILAWNPEAERMYGWTEAEALAMNVRDITPEPLRDQAIARARQLAHAETLEPYRTQRVTKDGRNLDVWLIATALLNDNGAPYAIATTERNIGSEGPIRASGSESTRKAHD